MKDGVSRRWIQQRENDVQFYLSAAAVDG